MASKARNAERSIGLPVAARGGARGTATGTGAAAPGAAAAAACTGAGAAAGGPADTPSQWSRSSVPGILRLAVMLGRLPSVASTWPVIAVPNAVRLPSKATRCPSPLKAPAAEIAPMPACGAPSPPPPAGWHPVSAAKAREVEAEILPERQRAGGPHRAAQQGRAGVAQRQRRPACRPRCRSADTRADLAVDEFRQAGIVDHLVGIRQRGVEGEVVARRGAEIGHRSLARPSWRPADRRP